MQPTGSMNVVVVPLQRTLIILNCITTSMSQGEWACEDEKDADHLEEIVGCNTVVENQASEHLCGPNGIVDMDVTAHRTIHYLKQRRWRNGYVSDEDFI